MKIFFDTNVYIAEALLGGAAERMINATIRARWRIFSSGYLLDETQRVLVEKLSCSRRFALLTRLGIRRRTNFVVPPASRHRVPQDPADSPILRSALAAGADILVSTDRHLLAITPYEGLKIMSMTEYFNMLVNEGRII